MTPVRLEEYRRLLRFGAYRVRLGYGSPDTRESTITMTTPITTPFKWETTAAEVVAGSDLSGNRVIVTGGASGIGLETARALAAAGAHVTLAVRNAEAGQRVAAEIVTTGTTHI